MLKWLVALVTIVAFARPADACGAWAMTDEEKSYMVSYLINSGRISNGKNWIGAIYLDDDAKAGLRSVKDHRVVFDVKGGKLRKYGKAIATINADGSVAFGKRVYTIELSNPHEEGDHFSSWDLSVKRGDKIIATSKEASALCAPMHRDPPWTDEQKQDEVRRRVMYYLAWRETGP